PPGAGIAPAAWRTSPGPPMLPAMASSRPHRLVRRLLLVAGGLALAGGAAPLPLPAAQDPPAATTPTRARIPLHELEPLPVSAVPDDPASITAESWDPTLARGATREIDFTTDEGTWMSLDVSPDGRWIAFDLLG